MTQLYKLAEQYNALINLIESEDTEDVDKDLVKAYTDKIEGDFKDKAINIGKLILTANADIKSIDVEINRLSLRKLNLERKSDWFKDYLKEQMITAQIDKIQGDVLNLSLRTNPASVLINNSDIIPQQFKREIPATWQPDKTAILKWAKETGEIIPGVEIIKDKKYLVIR